MLVCGRSLQRHFRKGTQEEMSLRIVLYKSGYLAATDEVLEEIERVSGVDRESIASLLRSRPAVFLSDLEEAAARQLFELLRAQGIDADLEPMELERDRVEWLEAEIPKWVKRGLVHVGLASLLYRNYGLQAPSSPVPEKKKDPGRLIRVVLSLGAILVGLGLILFIASNWQRIPSAVKILGSMTVTLTALHAAYRLKYVKENESRLASALFTIALFGIGSVVILIAQIYHVQADSYLLPAVWGGLCVPVGVFLRFRPGLYLAGGFWLVSYWLYAASHAHMAWFLPVLLLGFLVPYSLAMKEERLYRACLGALMLALVSTPAVPDIWMCSVWVLALLVFRFMFAKPFYDWLLVVGFVFWHITFMLEFGDFPDVFYVVPLIFFYFVSLKRRSSSLMIATVLNTLFWLLSLFLQLGERFELAEVSAAGLLLWAMATGILCFAIGMRVEPAEQWRLLSGALRYGGIVVVNLVVYALSFRFYRDDDAFFGSPLFLWTSLGFGAAAIGLVVVNVMAKAERAEGERSELALFALVVLSLLLAVLASPAHWVHVTLFNLILFGEAVVLMFRGNRADRLLWFNLGIGVFVLLIATRYFDTFVDLLPRSVFFVLGGIFLMAWAVLADRKRRRAAVEGESDA